MAYMSQERKSEIAVQVKRILAKYSIKGSLSVDNHSTLVLKIKSGPIDFIQNAIQTEKLYVNYASKGLRGDLRQDGYLDVNPYWYKQHFSGEALQILVELFDAMNDGNHNNSDIQSDYFDVGWYVSVKIGDWNKPYVVTK